MIFSLVLLFGIVSCQTLFYDECPILHEERKLNFEDIGFHSFWQYSSHVKRQLEHLDPDYVMSLHEFDEETFNTTHAEMFTHYGEVQCRRGQLNEASVAFNEALLLDSSRYYLHIYLGDLLRVLGFLDLAQSNYHIGHQLSSNLDSLFKMYEIDNTINDTAQLDPNYLKPLCAVVKKILVAMQSTIPSAQVCRKLENISLSNITINPQGHTKISVEDLFDVYLYRYFLKPWQTYLHSSSTENPNILEELDLEVNNETSTNSFWIEGGPVVELFATIMTPFISKTTGISLVRTKSSVTYFNKGTGDKAWQKNLSGGKVSLAIPIFGKYCTAPEMHLNIKKEHKRPSYILKPKEALLLGVSTLKIERPIINCEGALILLNWQIVTNKTCII